jgi:multidrug resistance protein, MATE family
VSITASNKNIIRLALPIALALAIPQLSFLANTAFLGRYGERELGINGIAGVYYLILSMIGYGLSSGIQVQMARREGENDKQGLAQTFMNGLLLSLALSLVLIILSFLLVPAIFNNSLHDQANSALSVQFLHVRIWGLPFFILTQIINSFFISVNRSRFLIYGSLAGTVVNIAFDYLLIFGHAGFPQLGLMGAAIASILGELANLLVIFGGFIVNKIYRTYPIHHFIRPDFALAKRSLKVSSPLIVQFLFSIGGWQIFFIFIEHLGTKEMAASQMLRSIFGIVGIGTWAMASTCNTMVSNIIGQGKPGEVMPIIKKIGKFSVLYAFIIGLILFIFPYQFLSLYRDDPALIQLAIPSLRIIVIGALIMAMSTVMFNGVVGTGNTLVNLSIEITCVGVYLIYCYFIIEKMRLGLTWAWGSEFVYWSSLFIISFLYLKSGKWKGKMI